jgi:hypothetical protein
VKIIDWWKKLRDNFPLMVQHDNGRRVLFPPQDNPMQKAHNFLLAIAGYVANAYLRI